MEDLESKLSKLLSSPEEMEQLSALARSISAKQQAEQNTDAAPDSAAAEPLAAVPCAAEESASSSNIDPATLAKILSFFSKSQLQNDDKRSALLQAIKPYLSPDRQQKIDHTMNMMRMSKLAKAAFSEFTGREDNV